MSQIEDLENRKPGQTVTIYPHTGVAIIKIAQVWALIAIITAAVVIIPTFFPAIKTSGFSELLSYGCIALWAGGTLFAAHQFLHYANTYMQFSDDAILYRTGWIPSHSDTIFWVNIKDINTSASVGESMLSSGTIILIVAIRTELTSIRIPFIPNYVRVSEIIRQRIGAANQGIRQISYT